MKTLKMILFGLSLSIVSIGILRAQTCSPSAPVCVPNNGYAFQWAGDTDHGLKFNTATTDYEFTDGSGNAVMGVDAFSGNIRIPGSGALQVGANRYAFQFDAQPNYGLFFNATGLSYDFRGPGAGQVFSIGANSGDVLSSGSITGIGQNVAGDFAVKGSGANGPTNGYLGVQGGTDFDGIVNLDINALEVGVLGVSTGTSNTDNIGVYGFANDVAVKARHNSNGNQVDLGTANYALEATGTSQFNGDAFVTGQMGIGTSNATATLDVLGTTELMGNVGINRAAAGLSIDLAIGIANQAVLQLGSAEQISDGGAGTFNFNAHLDPTSHLILDLGSSTEAWDEIYADNFNNVSDRRAKRDIKDLTYGLEEILALRPVSYILKQDPQEEVKLGLIAQEALSVVPESVKTHDIKLTEEGRYTMKEVDLLSMRYNMFIPVLINAVQEQNATIEELTAKLEDQSEEIQSLKAHLTACCNGLGSVPSPQYKIEDEMASVGYNNDSWLGQNVPNPFTHQTTIKYAVSEHAFQATISVVDMDGREVRNFQVANGQGELVFDQGSLAPGQYVYTLVVDGEVIDTKKMMVR